MDQDPIKIRSWMSVCVSYGTQSTRLIVDGNTVTENFPRNGYLKVGKVIFSAIKLTSVNVKLLKVF